MTASLERLVELLDRASLGEKGSLPLAVRLAARAPERAAPADLSGALRAYLVKLAREAHRLSAADLAAVRAAGLDDDQIHEATVSAAVGAGLRRLEAALGAIRGR